MPHDGDDIGVRRNRIGPEYRAHRIEDPPVVRTSFNPAKVFSRMAANVYKRFHASSGSRFRIQIGQEFGERNASAFHQVDVRLTEVLLQARKAGQEEIV